MQAVGCPRMCGVSTAAKRCGSGADGESYLFASSCLRGGRLPRAESASEGRAKQLPRRNGTRVPIPREDHEGVPVERGTAIGTGGGRFARRHTASQARACIKPLLQTLCVCTHRAVWTAERCSRVMKGVGTNAQEASTVTQHAVTHLGGLQSRPGRYSRYAAP
jgi:hypothetical protein